MRYRDVPPARDFDGLCRIYERVPESSDTVEDCCAHLVSETDIGTRAEASQWLVFLRALDLVETDEEGYYRVDDTLDRTTLADRFEERVLGASAIVSVVEESSTPLTSTEIANAIEESAPRSLRTDSDWRAEWEQYVGRLLEWAAVFGRLDRSDESDDTWVSGGQSGN